MCSLANDGKAGFRLPVCKVFSPSCECPTAVPGLDSQKVIALVGGAMAGCARPGPEPGFGNQSGPALMRLTGVEFMRLSLCG